ncbi:MAG: protein-glutamate O-methyltransferase CheR [Bacteroidota bacterium]|nr:protein-glutamate O-methyltransferase CheR [Bacteroidota bacterium]
MLNPKIEQIEFELLLEGIYQAYGYDFRDYAPASLRRRVQKSMDNLGVKTISEFQDKILHEKESFVHFLNTVSIDVTAMFRDPDFFLAVRQKIVPIIRELPSVRIWHAGCATGEEVYAMAILLQEENLYNKVRIYATDMNAVVLDKAKNGIYPLKNIQDCTANYHKSGGSHEFSTYYTAKYNNVIMKPELKKNIVWAQHNLVTDRSFHEFDLILCRNVMIYFERPLQEHVHQLFLDSMPIGGILGLGKKETMYSSAFRPNYMEMDGNAKLFRRVK